MVSFGLMFFLVPTLDFFLASYRFLTNFFRDTHLVSLIILFQKKRQPNPLYISPQARFFLIVGEFLNFTNYLQTNYAQ